MYRCILSGMKNQSGFSVIWILLTLIVAAVIGVGGWAIWSQSGKTTDKTAQADKTADKSPADNAGSIEEGASDGWKKYTWSSEGLSFKYPNGWFIEENATERRLYIRTTPTAVSKDERPADLRCFG